MIDIGRIVPPEPWAPPPDYVPFACQSCGRKEKEGYFIQASKQHCASCNTQHNFDPVKRQFVIDYGTGWDANGAPHRN